MKISKPNRMSAVILALAALACSLPGQTAQPTVPPSAAPTSSPATISPTATLSSEQAADVILYNGLVITMDGSTVTTAIAIKGDRVMTLGGDARILQLAGPETVRIDLDGRTILPGFVDSHSHLFGRSNGEFSDVQDQALSFGITTTAELGTSKDLTDTILSLAASGGLRMRVSLYLSHTDNCGGLVGQWYLDGYPVSLEPGARLQIPGVKMFNDGGSCLAPAVSFEYSGGSGHGDLFFEPEALAAEIEAAQAHGYQAAIHAAGDRAVESSLDAIAIAVQATDGANFLRHRIEHNTILTDALLGRHSEYGAIPTIFGAFPTCIFLSDTSAFKYITPEEFRDLEWRWRPLLDSNPGLPVAWTTDYPVFSLNPFDHLAGFVTRNQISDDGGLCEAPDWAADDRLSVNEALPMMTIHAAYAIRREAEIGSLNQGKLADLIILSANPYEVPAEGLADIQVLMTMVGGRTAFCRDGFEALCP